MGTRNTVPDEYRIEAIASDLRAIAQNDYMIDGAYLHNGEVLLDIASELERHQCDRAG